MPQISVIIPTYKHRDFVLATLDSVFAQTFTDIEIIVVNDGSPDDTAKVLRPLASSGHIRYIEQSNEGQAAARNRGLAEAHGEFIAFLDDDDLWPADKLEWQLKALKENPYTVFIYGAVSRVDKDFGLSIPPVPQQNLPPNENTTSGCVHEDFLRRNWLHSPGQALMRMEAVRRVNGFDETIWGADDYDLYIRLAEQGPILYNDHVSLYYRQHAQNASKNIKRMYQNVGTVRVKHLGRLPHGKNKHLWLANYHYWRCVYLPQAVEAVQVELTQDRQSAKRRWLEALGMLPGPSHCRQMFYLFRHLWLKPLS